MNLLIAFIPTLLYGIIDALAADTSKRVSSIVFVFLQNVITLLLFVVVISIYFPTPLFTARESWAAFFGGVLLAVGFIVFLRGLAIGKAGVVTAVAHAYILVAALIGMLWLGETTSSLRTAATLLVLAGLTVLTLRKSEARALLNGEGCRGTGLALVTALCWGVGYTLQKTAANAIPVLETALLVETGAVLVSASLFLLAGRKLREYKEIQSYDLRVIIFAGFSFFWTEVTIILAFSQFDLGLVTTVAGSSSIVTALLAYWWYRQKLTAREIAGILATVAGLTLLGLTA